MPKLTRDDLCKLRNKKQKTQDQRNLLINAPQIIVCMGTCGVAAGANETLKAILEELTAKGLTNVLVRQTGCMGLCHSEPIVKVIVPCMPTIIYGNVNAEIGKQIVNTHIINKHLIDNHICDKPAMDIIR